nr:endonuclease/exonuclease/phosphatase family protein [Sagittula salina]
MRVATWHAEFSRNGPGLLLRDLKAGKVDLAPILDTGPDLLLLTDFDYDAGLAALDALRTQLKAKGLALDHLFSARPNAGWQTGLDLDGDGRTGGPRDAQGYGRFAGQGGMALLSRYPVTLEADLSRLLWSEVPDSRMTPDDPAPDVQRLSSSAHWALRVDTPAGPLLLLTLCATPPVFDGPEDRNGRRNHDEVRLWAQYLDGALRLPPEPALGSLAHFADDLAAGPPPVVILGNLNLDPERGEGLHGAARALLAHPRITDPLPGVDTVTWASTGPMRVSYLLPDRALTVLGAGVMPPAPEAETGPHGLVWADLALPTP